MRGSHVLKTWSTTQPTIALSSAEAELIAAVRGAAEGLSALTLCTDFGRECRLRVHLDSSAALGIVKRRGVGKIRHLDTRSCGYRSASTRATCKLQRSLEPRTQPI